MNQKFLLEILEQDAGQEELFCQKEQVEEFVFHLFDFLFFPSKLCQPELSLLETEQKKLQYNWEKLLKKTASFGKAKEHSTLFFQSLSTLYQQLKQDAKAIYDFDPAANSLMEVFLSYPGFFATYCYRIANQMQKQGISVLPRLVSEIAHTKTGIDIHPAASIGESFFIDHGTGIVIGETCSIGNNVKIYQGVTLGALHVKKELAHKKRHPTIQDNVVIYSGATILGGETTIGYNSIIGGNVWITSSIAPNCMVYHKSEIMVHHANPFPEPLNFVI